MAYFRSYPQLGATGIAISPTSATVPIKGVLVFNVTVTPSGSSDEGDYTVTSSNTSVLTVVKSGMKVYAYGVALGSATITVSLNGHTATASTTVDYVGSYFVFNNNKYYYDFVIIDTSETSCVYVMQRYLYSGLKGQWGGTTTSRSDKTASFRTSIQTYINKNFSSTLLNALVTNSRRVVSLTNGSILEEYYSAKFFIPSDYESGNLATSKPSTDTFIRYLNRNTRWGETISGDVTITNELSRSIAYTASTRNSLSFKNVSPYYAQGDFSEEYPIRPYFFLNKNLHVRDEANSDGSYSIDWTGQSTKTLANLTTGTIIRDDSGTGRTG